MTASRTDANVERVTAVVRKCHLTFQKVEEEINMSWETERLILSKYLNFKKVFAKIVPKNLRNEQNMRQKKFSQTSAKLVEEHDFMEK
jgi:hypothetical protein